jgi:hypothetical protein
MSYGVALLGNRLSPRRVNQQATTSWENFKGLELNRKDSCPKDSCDILSELRLSSTQSRIRSPRSDAGINRE